MTFMTNRRALLASTVLVPLVACASHSGIPTPTPSQIQIDVQTLVDGLSGIVTALTGIAPPDVLAKIQAELDILKADAAAIANAVTPTQSVLQQIGQAVGIIADLATPFFPAAGVVAMVIQGAIAFLPTILGFLGITAARHPNAKIVAVQSHPLTVNQARIILIGAAHGIPSN